MYPARCASLHLPQPSTENECSGYTRLTLVDDKGICFIRVCSLRTHFLPVPDVDAGALIPRPYSAVLGGARVYRSRSPLQVFVIFANTGRVCLRIVDLSAPTGMFVVRACAFRRYL